MSTAVEKSDSQASSLPINSATEPSGDPSSVSISINVVVTPVANGLDWQMTHDGYTLNNGWIWVGADTATITFNLSLASGSTGTVAWAATPVQWVVDGVLSSTNPVNITPVVSGSTLTFTDYNFAATPDGNPHKFFLYVSYTPVGGTATTYCSPDPTIINKEPPTGSL